MFNRAFLAPSVEIEAKFHAPAPDVLEALAQITELAGFPLGDARQEEIADIYLDTKQWLILEGGFFCRLRLDGSRTIITIKQVQTSGEAIHRREEYEVELPEYVQPPLWPEGAARDKVLQLAGGQPLAEMLEIHQTRTKRLLGDVESPVAEMSLDAVRAGAGGKAPDEAGSTYYEVEVELKAGGTEDDLAAIVAEMRRAWPLEPETRSKFERAFEAAGYTRPAPAASHADMPADVEDTPLGAEAVPGDAETQAVPEEPAADDKAAKRKAKRQRKGYFLGDGLEVLEKPGLSPDDSMAEAARKTLLYHLQRMMLHEPGTRDGEDPEELHVMRVATRRMRAALRVFEGYVDMGRYKPFLKVMRQTGSELGAVRDLDVFMIKTQAYIDSLPPEQQSGLEPLVEAWRAERARARTELLTFLDSDGYQRFKEKFEAFLRTPGAGVGRKAGADGEPIPTRVGDILPGVLFDRLALVKAYDGPISQPDAPLAVFHQLRITSKGLRYTLEFFQEVLGSGGKPLIDRTKQVQDHLGDLQDAVVACDVMLGFLGSGTWGIARGDGKGARTVFPVYAPGVATYLAVKQGEIERLMHTFGPLWDLVRGSEFSRPLAELVATL